MLLSVRLGTPSLSASDLMPSSKKDREKDKEKDRDADDSRTGMELDIAVRQCRESHAPGRYAPGRGTLPHCISSSSYATPRDTAAGARLNSASNNTKSDNFDNIDKNNLSNNSNYHNPEKIEDGMRSKSSLINSVNSFNSWNTDLSPGQGGMSTSTSLSPSPSFSPSWEKRIGREILNPKNPDLMPSNRVIYETQYLGGKEKDKKRSIRGVQLLLKTEPSMPLLNDSIALGRDDECFELLVVDDSRLNRKMLCKVLRSKGHKCVEAEDGLEAVAKVIEKMEGGTGDAGEGSAVQGKTCYDAILMDFVMPNMDGPTGGRVTDGVTLHGSLFMADKVLRFMRCNTLSLTVLHSSNNHVNTRHSSILILTMHTTLLLTSKATKEIRALGYTAPIFGVTGNSLPSDVEHFLNHGADTVLIKPLNVDELNKAMISKSWVT